jgi:uncharacterized membrane protein
MLFDKNNKLYLLGLLALGVILAHYGTAILFIGLIIGYSIATRKIKYIVLSVTLFIIGFVWYRTQNSGIVANQVTSISQWVASTPAIGIGSGTIADVHSTFGNMIVRMFVQGVTYLPLPLLILYVISQVLIVAGFIIVSWRWILKKVRNISIGYMALALMSLGLLALELLMKQLANIIGIERIYLFCLMFLAPFVFVAINKFKRLEIVAVLFVGLFFLLNVGFINQVGGKPISNSIALNPNESDYPIFTSKEIEGANWLVTHTTGSIYTDTYSQFIFYYYNIPADDTYRVWSNIILFDLDKDSNPIVTNELSQGSYIYLRKFNIEHEEMTIHYFHYNTEGTVAYSLDRLGKFGQVVETAEIVYQNSDCKVLRTTIGYKAER